MLFVLVLPVLCGTVAVGLANFGPQFANSDRQLLNFNPVGTTLDVCSRPPLEMRIRCFAAQEIWYLENGVCVSNMGCPDTGTFATLADCKANCERLPDLNPCFRPPAELQTNCEQPVQLWVLSDTGRCVPVLACPDLGTFYTEQVCNAMCMSLEDYGSQNTLNSGGYGCNEVLWMVADGQCLERRVCPGQGIPNGYFPTVDDCLFSLQLQLSSPVAVDYCTVTLSSDACDREVSMWVVSGGQCLQTTGCPGFGGFLTEVGCVDSCGHLLVKQNVCTPNLSSVCARPTIIWFADRGECVRSSGCPVEGTFATRQNCQAACFADKRDQCAVTFDPSTCEAFQEVWVWRDGLCQNVVGCPTEGTFGTKDECIVNCDGMVSKHRAIGSGDDLYPIDFSQVPMDMLPLLTSMGKVVQAMLSGASRVLEQLEGGAGSVNDLENQLNLFPNLQNQHGGQSEMSENPDNPDYVLAQNVDQVPNLTSGDTTNIDRITNATSNVVIDVVEIWHENEDTDDTDKVKPDYQYLKSSCWIKGEEGCVPGECDGGYPNEQACLASGAGSVAPVLAIVLGLVVYLF